MPLITIEPKQVNQIEIGESNLSHLPWVHKIVQRNKACY